MHSDGTFERRINTGETRHLRKRLLLTHKKFQDNELCVRESMCSKVAQTRPSGRVGRQQHPVSGKSPEPLHLVTSVFVTLEEFLTPEGWSRDAAENNPAPVPAVPGGELV